MTLEQVAVKYNINPNNLNAKDDGLKVAVASIQDLVREMEMRRMEPSVVNKVKTLGEFLHEVSNSTIG
jgi:hypothetical protein